MTENEYKELSTRITIVETLLIQKEKSFDKITENVDDLLKKAEELKYEIKSKKIDEPIQNKITELEEQLDSIRLELPEIRLTKQIVMALVAIVLASFVGLLWSSVVQGQKSDDSEVNEIVKGIIDEYKKDGKKK